MKFPKQRTINKILTLILLSIIHSGTNAQWNASVTLDQEYNTNPFRSPEAQASWISNMNGKLQYDWQKYAIRYDGSYLKFNLMPERNFYWHQFALLGGSDTFIYGVTAEQRFDRSDYRMYDYISSAAYLNYRFKLSEIWLTSSNNISLNNYSQLKQLSNWQFNSRLQFNKGFHTKTSVIGGVGLYFKKYLPTQAEYVITGVDSIFSNQTFRGGGRGRGQGTYMTPIYEYLPSESPSLAQASYWLRIAQSITPTTGMAIQFQQRLLIKGLDRYISGLAYDYSSESQLFDDPMGYESLSIGSEITKLFPAGFTLKMAYYLTSKNYVSQGIYLDSENFDDQTLREDLFEMAWLSLKKQIFFSEVNDRGLILAFNFQWLKNHSNSHWYHYKNRNSSLGLELSF